MIKGINHVGISVANLDRSIQFYRDLIGMELLAQEVFHGEAYDKILALRAVEGKVALLKAKDLQIELFEFMQPRPASSPSFRPVCDHGISHFCIEVSNVDVEYCRLKDAGVIFHCPPMDFLGGTERATYARDPDGNVFELLEIKASGQSEPT